MSTKKTLIRAAALGDVTLARPQLGCRSGVSRQLVEMPRRRRLPARPSVRPLPSSVYFCSRAGPALTRSTPRRGGLPMQLRLRSVSAPTGAGSWVSLVQPAGILACLLLATVTNDGAFCKYH